MCIHMCNMAVYCVRSQTYVSVQVAMPGCLQQFINHNGVLHKVYVMGDQV